MVLTRHRYSSVGIFGTLVTDRGSEYATLEHAYPVGDAYLPKLGNGTYVCRKGMHCLKKGGPFQTFEIIGVLNHTGILFHVGNYNSDSEGCVLLGLTEQSNMVIHSKAAFERFMKELEGVNEFTLEVK